MDGDPIHSTPRSSLAVTRIKERERTWTDHGRRRSDRERGATTPLHAAGAHHEMWRGGRTAGAPSLPSSSSSPRGTTAPPSSSPTTPSPRDPDTSVTCSLPSRSHWTVAATVAPSGCTSPPPPLMLSVSLPLFWPRLFWIIWPRFVACRPLVWIWCTALELKLCSVYLSIRGFRMDFMQRMGSIRQITPRHEFHA